MFLTGAGALIAVMGAMKFSWQTFPLALCVIFLGIYAKIFVGVYAIKWTELSDRRNHYREEMERLSRTCKIPNDKDSAFKNKQK